jgi:hypothetical protein
MKGTWEQCEVLRNVGLRNCSVVGIDGRSAGSRCSRRVATQILKRFDGYETVNEKKLRDRRQWFVLATSRDGFAYLMI